MTFYAAPRDDEDLVAYAESIRLVLVPPTLPEGAFSSSSCRDPATYGLCYLSVEPVAQLHPYGNPPRKVSPATDPMIEFHRSRLENGRLTIGRIYWDDDVEEFGRRTKPAFEKLKKWVRANWRKQDTSYIGPEASKLAEHGVRFVGWKTLAAHLRLRWSMILGVLLAGVMVLLFIVGLTRPMDSEAIRKVDDILSEARRAEHAD